MSRQILTGFKVLLVMTFLTGGLYPLAITAIGQGIFFEKANGSLLKEKDQVVGSSLLAQKFVQEKYFWPRPSATEYSALPSGGSNLSQISKALKETVEQRKIALKSESPPSDLLFASASGLDPHISPAAAYFQIERIQKARNWDENQKQRLSQLVKEHIEKRQWGFLGEKRVNVLELNRALDSI
jgi:K+-transporting ATPase ATPase C chain